MLRGIYWQCGWPILWGFGFIYLLLFLRLGLPDWSQTCDLPASPSQHVGLQACTIALLKVGLFILESKQQYENKLGISGALY